MGNCLGATETAAYESVHYVDGWKFHLDIPNHDGGNDVHTSNSGTSFHSAELVDLYGICYSVF